MHNALCERPGVTERGPAPGRSCPRCIDKLTMTRYRANGGNEGLGRIAGSRVSLVRPERFELPT